jgi:hypothetical protein
MLTLSSSESDPNRTSLPPQRSSFARLGHARIAHRAGCPFEGFVCLSSRCSGVRSLRRWGVLRRGRWWRAQQKALPVIGFLSMGAAGAFAPYVAGFKRGLEAAGYFDGHNVMIEFRWVEGHRDKLALLSRPNLWIVVLPFS